MNRSRRSGRTNGIGIVVVVVTLVVARKWDHSDKRQPAAGRPAVSREITDLVLRFAHENPTWGYDRIQGALANPGYKVRDQTVGIILKANGIEPAPERKRQTTWETFLKAHAETHAAIDFTTTEVWTLKGLVTRFILVVMNLKTECVDRTIFFGEATLRKALREFETHYHEERSFLLAIAHG